MKKVIIFLFCVVLIFLICIKEEKYVIPKESIRFRILANSNNINDQMLKMNVRTALLPILNEISSDEDIEVVRNNITQNIDSIGKVVENYTDIYDISFGENYFPTKMYHDINYPEGNYESLVITLGDGAGDNWWCVLFPPLCLLEAKATDLDDVTYDYYYKKIINKYF